MFTQAKDPLENALVKKRGPGYHGSRRTLGTA